MIINLCCSICEKPICEVMVKRDYDLLKIVNALCPKCNKQGKRMNEEFEEFEDLT